MKKLHATIVIVLLSIHVFSQVPSWAWATNGNGSGYDGANCVVTDVSGNVYVTGFFYSQSITFDSYTLINADVTGNTQDMFIVKYDASGAVQWAENAGGTNTDGGYSATTDASGNVYVTGYFESLTIVFGSTTLSNNGLYSMFIVKYDATGAVVWAKGTRGTSDDYGRSVAIDASNNIYVTGSFKSPVINFDSHTLANTDNTGNSYDMFIVKYDSTGTFRWVKNAAGNTSEYARSVAIDTSGNIYVAGNFDSPVLTFGTTILTNNGATDIFIVKYDTTGAVVWANNAGGNGIDYGNSIATDRLGNIYLSGGFFSSSITFSATTLANAGIYNMYIVKYNSTGAMIWAKQAGGTGTDDGLNITTDIQGNAYVAGYFTSPTIAFGATSLTNAGGNDIFIVKYDSLGIVSWAQGIGESSDDKAFSVTTNISNIYLTGYFNSPTLTFGSNTITNGGADDMFLAKLSSSTGISEINNQLSITIYPNPTSSQTTITFNEEQKNTTIKIVDIVGKGIKTINFTGRQFVLAKGEMKAGIYFVQTTDEQKNIANKKIIIQ